MKICSSNFCLYSFKIWRFEIWRFEFCRQGIHAENLTRPDLPLRGGRRIDNPKGDHRRPPTLFSLCELGQGLWDSWLLGSLQTLLEPPGVLLGASWGLLGCSWGGLEGFLGPIGRLLDPLGASWKASWALLRRPKCDKENMAKTAQLPDPQTSSRPRPWGGVGGAQNRPKSDPKRIQI